MSQGFTRGVPIDIDPNLTANSNLLVPSQAAVIAYVTSHGGASGGGPANTIYTSDGTITNTAGTSNTRTVSLGVNNDLVFTNALGQSIKLSASNLFLTNYDTQFDGSNNTFASLNVTGSAVMQGYANVMGYLDVGNGSGGISINGPAAPGRENLIEFTPISTNPTPIVGNGGIYVNSTNNHLYYVSPSGTRTDLINTGTSMNWPTSPGLAYYNGASGWSTSVTTSAGLAGVITDETGSGALVFGTSPTITTSLVAGSSSFDLIDTTATTVNFARAATTINMGALGVSGTPSNLNIRSSIVTFNDTQGNGGVSPFTIQTTYNNGTVNLFNTSAAQINLGAASTSTNIGSSTVGSTMVFRGQNFGMQGTDPSIATATNLSTGTAHIFNEHITKARLFNAADTVTIGGITSIRTFGSNPTSVPNTGNTTLNLMIGPTASGNTKTFNIGTGGDAGHNVNINIGSTNTNLSNSTTLVYTKLVVKGDLQVDGTTTTLNSATLTVDDKNIELGSVNNDILNTSSPTISSVTSGSFKGYTSSTGSTTLTVTDIYSGTIYVGATITGTGIPGGVTITAFVTGTGGTGTYTLSSSIIIASPGITINFVNSTGYWVAVISGITNTNIVTINDPIVVSGSPGSLGGKVGNVMSVGSNTLTVSITGSSPVPTTGALISVTRLTSTTGTIDAVINNPSTGVWTGTITGMTDVVNIIIGSRLYSTPSVGSFSTGIVKVTQVLSTTSVAYTTDVLPTAGAIINIYTSGATDDTANGGGITLKGTTDKTFTWVSSTPAWTSSENFDIASGKTYKINTTDVLSSTTLGANVIYSSLTKVGALSAGTAGFVKVDATGNLTSDANSYVTPSSLTTTLSGYQTTNANLTSLIGLSPTTGNLILGNGSSWTVYSPGTSGQVLTSTGTSSAPTWQTPTTTEPTFANDLSVYLSGTKSFGKYQNGSIIPATGKTAREVIQMAITETQAPTATLTLSGSTAGYRTANTIFLNQTAVSNVLNFTKTAIAPATGFTTGSGAVLLEWRRNNTGTWTTLTTNASLTTFTHTLTDTANNAQPFNYRYTVTDNLGTSTSVTFDVTPTHTYPTVTITALGTTTQPSTNTTTRELGNINTYVIGSITRNNPNINPTYYTIDYSVDGGVTFLTLDSAVITNYPTQSVSSALLTPPVGAINSTSIKWKLVSVDPSPLGSTSTISTINFFHKNFILYSTSSTIGMTEINAATSTVTFTNNKNITFTGVTATSTQYTYYVYASSAGNLTGVIQDGAAPVLGAFTLQTDVTGTNSYGATVSYRIYKSNALGAFTNNSLAFS